MHADFSSSGFIRIRGARQHNLGNLDLVIPKNCLVVITGPSGSGKSSLAFDTLFAEGQRRYLETLSTYARQFLSQLQKPEVDFIEGLSPAIAIGGYRMATYSRSTVGSMTEIEHYLRLLFSLVGVAHEPKSGEIIERQSLQEITDTILMLPLGTRVILLSPLKQERGESYEELLLRVEREGFVRIRIDGKILSMEEAAAFFFPKNHHFNHQIEIVVDRLMIQEGIKQRLEDSILTALRWGGNRLLSLSQQPGSTEWEEHYFSTDFCHPKTGFTMPALTPRSFSIHHPQAACPTCQGVGFFTSEKQSSPSHHASFCHELPVCPTCLGKQFRAEILAVTLLEKNRQWNIHDFSRLSIREAKRVLENLELSASATLLLEEVLLPMKKRLHFLEELGLGYLTLHRESGTLSGGEMQRTRLATQVGSALSGVLYVLDEPSIGLHPRDHARLLRILEELRDLGNSVIVLEHDEETMLAADYLIDMGPGAGVHGGQIIAQGTLAEIRAHPHSLTGGYLNGRLKLHTTSKRLLPAAKQASHKGWISIIGASENNLKNLTVAFPLGLFTCVTGVSGSGKSTLVNKIFYPAMMKMLHNTALKVGKHDALLGGDQINKIIMIDQTPIGKTPRSYPATYIEILTPIRELFANLPSAKMRGYTSSYFSSNLRGGRCEHCQGEGVRRVAMHFLADVFLPCDLCEGKRFQRDALEIRFKGRSIADVLAMSVEEACAFFSSIPKIHEKLLSLQQVGLGYLTLGQSSTTLSAGEAQRLKLAAELGKRETGKTLYLLDEPTSGLHFSDIQKLLDILFELRDRGNTVILIEHHLSVIKNADWIIDLGPEGGEEGGELVVAGTLEELISCSRSITGRILAQKL